MYESECLTCGHLLARPEVTQTRTHLKAEGGELQGMCRLLFERGGASSVLHGRATLVSQENGEG